MLKVTFLHHSCFVVEMDESMLIFDYVPKGEFNGYVFTGNLPEFPKSKDIYVFASHAHKDHFDLEILNWEKTYPNIRYILSKDIRLGKNYLARNGIDGSIKEKITFVSPCEKYTVQNAGIITLRSTDAGVAYLVSIEGKYIYHAGDLNLWKWEGAGDLINGKEIRAYQHEIKKLIPYNIEAAFVPLDPRLEQNACLGMDYFLKNVNAKYVFPMHMWQDYSVLTQYLSRISNPMFSGRIAQITGENEVFDL